MHEGCRICTASPSFPVLSALLYAGMLGLCEEHETGTGGTATLGCCEHEKMNLIWMAVKRRFCLSIVALSQYDSILK